MYLHPVTSEQLGKVSAWGYRIISPVEKKLACGDYGIGGMAEVDCIINSIFE
jgi:phosphopantothenoylcysteine decarboxylase